MENKNYLAVLDKFPNVKGQTLVFPKKHSGSYFFDLNDNEYVELMLFSKKVGKKIDGKLNSVRTCLVLEGMEIDHVHVKLYPIHNVITNISDKIVNLNDYPGYLDTNHGKEATNKELKNIYKLFI
ncbi:HIT family protein [Candidatus Woesearchaeota archaeon]|nr:HIT family protein [Candidatus Woesearchaeota archaeon]